MVAHQFSDTSASLGVPLPFLVASLSSGPLWDGVPLGSSVGAEGLGMPISPTEALEVMEAWGWAGVTAPETETEGLGLEPPNGDGRMPVVAAATVTPPTMQAARVATSPNRKG